MKFSKDGVVSFDESNHSYYKDGSRLTSVTTFINKYKNKFDSEYHSKRIAEREGKTQDQVLKEWSDKALKSTTMGTYIHKIFEDYINGLEYKDSGVYQKEKVAIKFINDMFLTERLRPIGCEDIVYNNFLAGQVDCKAEDQKGNRYILDWKTNEEISTYSYGKRMLGIFSHLDDHAHNHYMIQPSIYQRLDGNVKECFVVHIMENDYKIIKVQDVLKGVDLSFVGL